MHMLFGSFLLTVSLKQMWKTNPLHPKKISSVFPLGASNTSAVSKGWLWSEMDLWMFVKVRRHGWQAAVCLQVCWEPKMGTAIFSLSCRGQKPEGLGTHEYILSLISFYFLLNGKITESKIWVPILAQTFTALSPQVTTLLSLSFPSVDTCLIMMQGAHFQACSRYSIHFF
jgi:hypothetical protein